MSVKSGQNKAFGSISFSMITYTNKIDKKTKVLYNKTKRNKMKQNKNKQK